MSAPAYLNSDLELRSEGDLRELASEMSANGLFVLNEEIVATGFANFECEACFQMPADTIKAVLSAIESLPDKTRSVFAACNTRAIDIGFQSGAGTRSIAVELPLDILVRLVALSVVVRITVYPSD